MHDKLTMEAIVFQKGRTFPESLGNIFTSCQKSYPNLDEIERHLESLSGLIKQEMGFKFTFKLVGVSNLEVLLGAKYKIFVEMPSLNTFSPFDYKAVARMETADLSSFKQADVIRGKIDPVKVRVSGCFSEIEYKTMFSDTWFDGSLDVDDAVNAFIHELGHAWDHCWFMGNTLITSAFAGVALGQIREDVPVEKRMAIGTALLKSYGVNKDLSADQANADVVVGLLLNNQALAMEKRLGRRYEAEREAERRADQFASRWGRGASLAKTLMKMEASGGIMGSLKIQPKWHGVLGSLTQAGLLGMAITKKTLKDMPALGATGASGFAAGFIGFGIAAVIVEVCVTSALETVMLWLKPQGGHPSLEERIRFLRTDTVGILKQDLPDDLRRAVLSDLEELDKIADDARKLTGSFTRLRTYAASVMNGTYNRRLHDRVESELSNNPLHELTAVLKG